jgi:dTDP-4-dehydrorhamnose reductase
MPGVEAVPLDLADEKAIQRTMETIQPAAVIHTAAWSDLDGCKRDPKQAFHINATATEILAEMSSRLGCRLVYVSSDMVFDGGRGNYSEEDTPRPINVYGKTKLTGEKFIQSVCRDFAIARAALIYGKPVTGSNSFSEKIKQVVGTGEVMRLFTDQFRTPVLVENLAEALLELSENAFVGTIHLGGAERVNRYDFGLRLAELNHLPVELMKPVSMGDILMDAPRPRDVSLNTGLARKKLKIPLPGFREGLKHA